MASDSTNEIIMPISDLLGKNFYIPAYQRGYRWTKRQVTDLLDDIRDFKFKPEKDEWYCLQPLVVKAKDKEKNEWEVIDGQQRLTTIFLIIHYINQKWVGEDKESEPAIRYQTRDRDDSSAKDGSYQFLKNIKVENDDVEINNKNIDYHYISSAYWAIHDWVKRNKGKFDRDDFQSKFKKKTKVIWYETDPKQDGRDIFSRINKGKIELTNAELIKALFLNSSNFNYERDEELRLKQLQIAAEWDIMETELYNDEFWLFINKEENNKETRIEYLFELIVGESGGTKDKYFTFRKFQKNFKDNTGETIEENWKIIKRCFQTLKYWFEDRELYHKIGFLITVGEDVKNLLEQSQAQDKLEFKDTINGKIKGKFENIQIDDIEYKNTEKVKNILLMHNIQTMLNNEKENSRFPFNRFKGEKWDIEHIHAIATEMPDTEEHQKDWLNYAKDHIQKEETNLLERINNYSKETFERLFKDIMDYFEKKGELEEVNELSNLVLLDMKTNRGYKNAFFRFKRMTIIEKEKKGVFVPLCTKNVFMKFYTREIKQINLWDDEDRKYYLDDIKESFSKLFAKGR